MEISFRVSKIEEMSILREWFSEPGILTFQPMSTAVEVEDAVYIWFSYIRSNAAYTCEVDGRPAGFATLYLNPFRKLQHQTLFSIIIDKELRGKGVGGKFVDFLINEAKNAHGIKKLHLEVYEGNTAFHLYIKKGFTEYGRHPDFLKHGDTYLTKILMEKELL